MMNDDSGKSKKLSLSGSRLTLGGLEAGQPRANTGGAARRTVQVEVRRKRAPAAPHRATTPKADPVEATPKAAPVAAPVPAPESDADDRLTAQERAARVRALQEGMKKPETETPPGAALDTAPEAQAETPGGAAPAAGAAAPDPGGAALRPPYLESFLRRVEPDPPSPAWGGTSASIPRLTARGPLSSVGLDLAATLQGPTEGQLVGVLEIATDRETTCDPADTNTHRLEVLDQQRRCRLSLKVGVRGDDDLLDVLISDTRHEFLHAELLNTHAINRAERSLEHVIAATELLGSLDRHDVL